MGQSLILSDTHYLQVFDSRGSLKLVTAIEAKVGDQLLIQDHNQPKMTTITKWSTVFCPANEMIAITTSNTNLLCSDIFVSSLTSGGQATI